MKKLNIAIVGTGRIASGGHAPALLRSKHAQLWSVMSRDMKRANEFAAQFKAQSKTPAYTELDLLLQDPALDAVIIATPDKLHAEQAVAAAKAGKHLLLEKPLATDAKGIAQVVASSSQAKITVGLCYRLHWHAGHKAIIDAVHGGKFGDIHHVRAMWTEKQADSTNWRASADVGRWWSLGANGTHLLDLCRWILLPSQGEIVEMKCVTAHEKWQGPHDETAAAVFRFKGGATAEICSSVLFEAPNRLEIYGAKGWVIFTHDLDFGILLAHRRDGGPSVLQVRTQDVSPAHLGPIVVTTLRAHREVLESGALLTIDESKSRVRILPI